MTLFSDLSEQKEFCDHIKILISTSNQHIVGYLYDEDTSPDYFVVIDPMLIHYHPIYEENSPGKFEASFLRFCALSKENLYEFRKDWIVAITDPDDGVVESYLNTIESPYLEPQYYDGNTSSPE